MAAPVSRPDPSSPASVAEAAFSTTRRGYHPDEVRAFLVAVAAELGRLTERERQLAAELRDARANQSVTELDDETVANLLGEETLRVLQTARESASQIKIRAEENAARLVREATDEAHRLRQEIDIEAARRRQDAQSDAEAEVALAKQQGREMVNEARAYRERVLADLDRRTTLARQQIEELMNGRDRLLQVFERARLVAVDVTAGLRAVEEPDELVNLTPTTGPVPIMVPNQRREEAPEVAADEAPADPDTDATDTDATDTDATDTDATDAADHGDAVGADLDEIGTEAEIEADVADDATDETSDVVDDEAGEPDDADAAHADEAADAAAPTPNDRANVVSLFGDRVPAAEAAIADDHPSVDDLFARLRHETDTDTDTETDTDTAADSDVAEAATSADDVAAADTPDEEHHEPTAFSRRDEALVPLIVAGARRLKRVLADEQNEALDMLRQGEAVVSIDAIVPLVDEHGATYTDALAEELADAAVAGAVEAGARDTAKLRTKLVDGGALRAAHDQMHASLVAPLRSRLERAIGDGDGDNEVITKRVRAVYREWKTQHIDTELDHVFRAAFSSGLSSTVKAGTPLVWTVDPSVAACPDCEDNSLAGSVPSGEVFPTGHVAAPAHPGCRCLALPVD
jgi:DivIVA domain-containing protein